MKALRFRIVIEEGDWNKKGFIKGKHDKTFQFQTHATRLKEAQPQLNELTKSTLMLLRFQRYFK